MALWLQLAYSHFSAVCCVTLWDKLLYYAVHHYLSREYHTLLILVSSLSHFHLLLMYTLLQNPQVSFAANLFQDSSSAAAARSLQTCPTLCDPIDGSPLGSSVPGILQARILDWVAISFYNAWTWKVKVKSLSHARLLATPWTAAYQAPPSMGFSRQEYWSGVPLPSPDPYLIPLLML